VIATSKLLRRALGAALIFALPVAAQQAAAPMQVTLADAIQRAGGVSPQVVSAQGQLRSAELGVRTQYWQYIPQLTFPVGAALNLSSGKSRLDPVTGELISGNVTDPSYSLGARASLTIFDGFRRSHDMGAARAQQTAADVGLLNAKMQTTLSVTNAFFDALAASEVLTVNVAAVDRAEQQLRVATARLQSGAGQRTDSLTALVQLGQARQQLLSAQAALATSEASLGRLIGSDGRVSPLDDPTFYQQPVLLDTAGVRQEAILSAPTIRTAEANLAAAKARLRAQKTGYWPTINLSASSDWTASKQNDYTLEPRRRLGISLNFSPWTSLQRETGIENAAITVDNQIATLADQRRQLQSQLTQQYAALGNAREAIEVAGISVQASDENVRVTEQRYRLGVATIFELMQAQEQQTQAEVNEIQARFSYIRAKAQIEALVGRAL
jgi:outer membrane protein